MNIAPQCAGNDPVTENTWPKFSFLFFYIGARRKFLLLLFSVIVWPCKRIEERELCGPDSVGGEPNGCREAFLWKQPLAHSRPHKFCASARWRH